jgi:hypothetical protein
MALVAGLAGVALYSFQYFSRPPLLMDEVRLSLDVAGTSWLGLTRPLGFDQTAPLLFLWAEKLATAIGGVNEFSLHFLPFVASVALLPLLWLAARRLIGPWGAALTVAIAALSPLLAQYSRQAKPYSLDAVVAMTITLWALDWLDSPDEPGPARRLLLAGVVGVWLSIPAVFAVVGVVLALAAAPPRQRPPIAALATVAIASLVSFSAAYFWIYRPAVRDPYMQQFWEYSLLTLWRPGLIARAWQGTRELVWQTFVGGSTEPGTTALFQHAVSATTGPLLLLLAVGTARLKQWAGTTRTVLIWAPVGVAVAASLLGKYPLAARTMLFAVPIFVLAAAAAVVGLIGSFRPAWRWAVAGVVASCLLGPALWMDADLVRSVVAYENLREAAAVYRARRGSGDVIYVFTAALPGWTFYTTDWEAPDTARLARMTRLGSFGGPAFENAPSRGRAVREEGDSLVYPLWGGSEMLGLLHGAQSRSGIGVTATAPDTNWVANEARRIRDAASPAVWVLTTHTMGLDDALREATGLCLDWFVARNGFALTRLVRPPAAADCPPGQELRPLGEAGR